MNQAHFRFYEELNDFLPAEKRKQRFLYSFNGNPAVKDAIEALGIPHTEVDLILICKKGEKETVSVDFKYQVQDQESISVYPVFESLDITYVQKLKKKPLRNTKFILDVHLGKLARLLRFLGFDSYYRNNLDDAGIINISLKEKRIILTRDKGILKNGLVTHGYYVRSTYPDKQLEEIVERFDLKSKIKANNFIPFSRCLVCNGKIVRLDVDNIENNGEKMVLINNNWNNLKQKIKQEYAEFFHCLKCQKIYWKGSHYRNLSLNLNKILN